jgi:hypothetical protein
VQEIVVPVVNKADLQKFGVTLHMCVRLLAACRLPRPAWCGITHAEAPPQADQHGTTARPGAFRCPGSKARC